MKGEAETQG